MASEHPSPVAHLELHTGRSWVRAGAVHVQDPSRGISSPSRFEYDFDYLDGAAGSLGARFAAAVSCRFPVGYASFDEARWPPFLLDMIPSGAARRHWEGRLGLPNNAGSDWAILTAGATNPPGNVRVECERASSNHPGFPRSDILERAEGFIEYAHACGAPVSGSSGAGGDSPKFLLREDHSGRWHADGELSDDRTAHCWLVKFPRTREADDRMILEAEAGYHRIARRFGVRTRGEVTWERDCLFVPRFDRVVAGELMTYLGLESLCSLAGVAAFGVPIPKANLALALATFSTDKHADLREFVLRDILDVALGNTDNHARNTSVLKGHDGTVTLSPIYDFAPMILDRGGIARVCRWSDRSDFPDWARVAEELSALGVDLTETKAWLHDLSDAVDALPSMLRDEAVPGAVRDRCKPRIERVARDLKAVA